MKQQCPPWHHFKWVKSDLIHSKFLNCDELQTSVKNGLTAVDSVRYINDTYLSYLLSALVKHYQHYLHVTKYERPILDSKTRLEQSFSAEQHCKYLDTRYFMSEMTVWSNGYAMMWNQCQLQSTSLCKNIFSLLYIKLLTTVHRINMVLVWVCGLMTSIK